MSGDEESIYRKAGRGRPPSVASEGMTILDLPRNGLTPDAITRGALTADGTQDLLRAITDGALADAATWRDHTAWIKDNKDVRSLMEYVVSCALDSGVEVNPDIDVPGEGWVTWPGHLGLCGARPEAFGNWAYAKPTPECQKIVSSCVLARVNAHERKVTISMRGESIELLPLRPKVPVAKEYRESPNTLIQSFTTSCGPLEAGLGPARDCAWEARYVGSCIPDQVVTLRTRRTLPPPPTDFPAMVRVCQGIHGCDHRNTPTTPWYAGTLTSADASTGPVSFRCPRPGDSLRHLSYFSVMLASEDPTVLLPVDADVTVDWGLGWYPSTEQEVFSYREGAFFGDIFDTREIDQDPAHNDDLLVGTQYACYSDVWSNGTAALNDRYCASPESECFENAPKLCEERCGPRSWETQAYRYCSWHEPARLWKYPITVYLNHPCDLARDFQTCQVAYPGVLTP